MSNQASPNQAKQTYSRKLLFVFTKPPHSSLASKEGLDALLTAAAFGQEVSLLLLGDGIYQILSHQEPSSLPTKNTAAMFSALEMYEIDKIFAHDLGLTERNLTMDHLHIAPKILNNQEITQLLNNQHQILTF